MERRRQRQQGFTLIEIIAVIVLLGVLAAVLVPKYSDLTSEARGKAAMQAIAEGQARVNAAAARYILATGSVPTTYTAMTASPAGNTLSTGAGDYTLAFAATTSGVAMTASGPGGATATGSAAFPQ